MEQIRLQEDLPIRDGDDVGGNICRDIVALGLDDRQRGHGSASPLIAQPAGTLQQPRVQIEDIARICLTSGRALQQQRNGPIGDGMRAEVIKDDQHILAFLHPFLAYGTAGIRRHILHERRIGSGRRDDDGMVHGAVSGQLFSELCARRRLLPDRDIDAFDLLSLLVHDGVQRDRALSALSVPDDQLALSLADGDQRIDHQDAGLQRFAHALPRHDARRFFFQRPLFLCLQHAAIQRLSQRGDDMAKQRVPDRDLHHAAAAPHRIACLDLAGIIQQHSAYRVFFQVHRDAAHRMRKIQQLAGHDILQAAYAGDAVST